MFKPKSFVAHASIALVCAGMLSLAGCGSGEAAADRSAEDALQQVDQDRAKAESVDNFKVEDLAPIQKRYDDLANDHTLSTTMQVIIRGRQAQVRQERIAMMVADLRAQELVISRDIEDMRELAMQVGGAQWSANALKSYDPSTQIANLKTQLAQAQGSADQLTWTMSDRTSNDPNSSVTLPTLFAAKQEVVNLNAKIQQDQTDADADHKLSAAKGDEAEMYLRRAEGETGDQQVQDATNAAVDRRDAALADAKAATLANDLQRTKADLDRSANQQSSLEAAIKSINDEIQSRQARWSGISDQIVAQQKVEQTLIGDPSTPSTISSLAADLATRLQGAAALREKINDELNAVIQQLDTAIMQCKQLRTEWMADVQQKADDPDVIIWRQAEETLHPMNFGLQKAAALESRATVAAAKARIDQQLFHLLSGDEIPASEAAIHFKNLDVAALKSNKIELPGLNNLLDPKNTGVPRPKALSDLPQLDFDAISQAKSDVDKAFQDTVDAYDPSKYGVVDNGPAADQRRNVALMDGAEANRKWALFAEAMGDDAGAQNHTQDAATLEGQIDASFALSTAAASIPAPAAATNARAPGAQ